METPCNVLSCIFIRQSLCSKLDILDDDGILTQRNILIDRLKQIAHDIAIAWCNTTLVNKIAEHPKCIGIHLSRSDRHSLSPVIQSVVILERGEVLSWVFYVELQTAEGIIGVQRQNNC